MGKVIRKGYGWLFVIAMLLALCWPEIPAHAESASVSVSVTGSNGNVNVDIVATEGATGSATATVNGETIVNETVIGPGEFHFTSAHERALAARERARERAAQYGTGKP